MIANFRPPVTTVTSRLGRDKFEKFLDEIIKVHDEATVLLSNRKRSDASVPNFKVRDLLTLAKSRGMTPKLFELTCARLEPNSASHSGAGFNGNLWGHYMRSDAPMSCTFFNQYACEFFVLGWLTAQERDCFVNSGISVQVHAKLGRPATADELELQLCLLWLRFTISRLAPSMPGRALGQVMRHVTSLPAEEQAPMAREAAHQLLMIEAHGNKIDKRDKSKFGTNLTH